MNVRYAQWASGILPRPKSKSTYTMSSSSQSQQNAQQRLLDPHTKKQITKLPHTTNCVHITIHMFANNNEDMM